MSYDKRQATAEFTAWSRGYDRSILQLLLFGPSHRALTRRLGRRYGDRPIRILDVGCGTGQFAARLRQALPNATVVGLDLVRGMLAKGAHRWKALAPEVAPVQGDGERLPFAAGTFDAITCANSFHHYPNQAGAIAEMERVLKPDGRLMLIDGYRDAPWGWFIYDLCVATVEGAVHHASRRTMHDYCRRAGFGEVEQKVYRGPAPFLFTEAVAPNRTIPAPHFATRETAAGRRARVS